MRAAALLWAAALLTAAGAPPPLAPWASAPVPSDARRVPASQYRVKPGDTLSTVVERTGAGADAIARANRIDPPYRLVAGRLLSIPPGRYHRVRRGQSGIAIGLAYGLDWSRVATLNHLPPPFTLRAGDRLLLPDEPAHLTLEQRAARFHLDLDDLVTGSAPALARKAEPVPATPRPMRPLAPTTPVATPVPPVGGRFAWPVEGRIVRAFGPTPEGGRNDGIDIAAPSGTPILAAADGAVAWAGGYPAFGQVILLSHGGGRVTIYGRVGTLLVARGQAVTQGQPIGRVGGPLHFEIRPGRKPVDPVGLLR